jgi:hypothetical protein
MSKFLLQLSESRLIRAHLSVPTKGIAGIGRIFPAPPLKDSMTDPQFFFNLKAAFPAALLQANCFPLEIGIISPTFLGTHIDLLFNG